MRVGIVGHAIAIAVRQAGLGVVVDAVAVPVAPEAVRVRVGVLQIAHAIAIPVLFLIIDAVVVPIVVNVEIGGRRVGAVGDAVAIRVVVRNLRVVIDTVGIGIRPYRGIVGIAVL